MRLPILLLLSFSWSVFAEEKSLEEKYGEVIPSKLEKYGKPIPQSLDSKYGKPIPPRQGAKQEEIIPQSEVAKKHGQIIPARKEKLPSLYDHVKEPQVSSPQPKPARTRPVAQEVEQPPGKLGVDGWKKALLNIQDKVKNSECAQQNKEALKTLLAAITERQFIELKNPANLVEYEETAGGTNHIRERQEGQPALIDLLLYFPGQQIRLADQMKFEANRNSKLKNEAKQALLTEAKNRLEVANRFKKLMEEYDKYRFKIGKEEEKKLEEIKTKLVDMAKPYLQTKLEKTWRKIFEQAGFEMNSFYNHSKYGISASLKKDGKEYYVKIDPKGEIQLSTGEILTKNAYCSIPLEMSDFGENMPEGFKPPRNFTFQASYVGNWATAEQEPPQAIWHADEYFAPYTKDLMQSLKRNMIYAGQQMDRPDQRELELAVESLLKKTASTP